jgi:hypothetical protein
VRRRQQPGRDLIGKDVHPSEIRDAPIEPIELGEAAAEVDADPSRTGCPSSSFNGDSPLAADHHRKKASR